MDLGNEILFFIESESGWSAGIENVLPPLAKWDHGHPVSRLKPKAQRKGVTGKDGRGI